MKEELKPIQSTSILQLEEEGFTICEFSNIVAKTNKAILIDFGDREDWIPLSNCVYGVDPDTGTPIIAIKDWLYQKLGL